jgi:hypothetical protein
MSKSVTFTGSNRKKVLASRAPGFLHTFHSRARNWTLPTLEFIKISVYSFYKWMKKTHNSAPCCALALLTLKVIKIDCSGQQHSHSLPRRRAVSFVNAFFYTFYTQKIMLISRSQSKQVMWRQRGGSECVCVWCILYLDLKAHARRNFSPSASFFSCRFCAGEWRIKMCRLDGNWWRSALLCCRERAADTRTHPTSCQIIRRYTKKNC